MKREINTIVIHCSATKVTADYSPEQLRRDHIARGFNRAGYHFYIRKSGYVVKLRPLEMIGAHVKGHNKNSIGICYEGGIDATGKATDTRNTEQKEALIALLKELKTLYPKAEIVGHRDLSPDKNGDGKITKDEWIKICPCFDAKAEYKNIK